MSSKNKIINLVLLNTFAFLLRDTLMIDGPIDMTPTFIVLFMSTVLFFFSILLFEDKKTQNHSKVKLAIITTAVSTLCILSAYVLNIHSYLNTDFIPKLLSNLQLFINNIKGFGFLIILANIIFALVFGSNQSLVSTYSYKSSKHTVKNKRWNK